MRVLAVLSLIAGISFGRASTTGDVLLSGYYLGKASVPFWLLPVAIEDGDQVLLVDVGLMAVLTVPASGVLYHRWLGNPGKIELWRKINFGLDLALASSGAAWGLWTMTSPNSDDGDYPGLVGAIGLVFSAVYATTCILDLVPFSAESSPISGLTLQPVYSLHSNRPGVILQIHF